MWFKMRYSHTSIFLLFSNPEAGTIWSMGPNLAIYIFLQVVTLNATASNCLPTWTIHSIHFVLPMADFTLQGWTEDFMTLLQLMTGKDWICLLSDQPLHRRISYICSSLYLYIAYSCAWISIKNPKSHHNNRDILEQTGNASLIFNYHYK